MTPTPMPAWLIRVRGPSRYATLANCPRCHRPMLCGLDDDTAALFVHADPTPLTAEQELAALLTGHRTYDAILDTVRNRLRLYHRTRWHMADRHHPVLADHRCQVTWPSLTGPAARPAARPQPEGDPDACPF